VKTRSAAKTPIAHRSSPWSALAIVLGSLAPNASTAAPAVGAKVLSAGVYGDGGLYVALDTVIEEPACRVARFDLPAAHPAAKQVFAMAEIALGTGKTVQVVTSGCFGSFPTLDMSRTSYFYVQ
jgi:hypothetical protein